MSGQGIRKKFRAQFTGMTKYSRWAAWAVVGWFVAQVLAGMALGSYLLSLPLSWLSVGMMILTSLFIGTRFRGLNNIVHECSHSSFSKYRGDNTAIGRFCSALLTGCFRQYKADHLSHHAHLGDYEHDKEMRAIEKFRLHEPLTVPTILRHFATPLLGLHLKAYSGFSLSSADGKFFFGLKVALMIAVVIFAVFEPLTAVFFLLIPLFYVFPTLNFWTDCLDHAGLVGATDELEASRNVLASAPMRLIFFPRNDCYHLVHHLFPLVPARHLKGAHEELCSDPEYLRQPLATRPTRQEVADLFSAAISPGKSTVAQRTGS